LIILLPSLTYAALEKIDELLKGWTLNLSFYEIGKYVWKQVLFHRKLSLDEGKIVLDSLISIFQMMNKVEEINIIASLEIAAKEGITFYDASYIEAAREKEMKLVTDDSKLYEIAKKYVNCINSEQI